jgi:hypothetical protein
MSQNRSSAVMQQRSEPHDSLDDFPTPPWATRALCEWLQQNVDQGLADRTCREPAANRGHMVSPLREYFASVDASDVHDYGAGFRTLDYLFPGGMAEVDWTITNPPFRLAEQFIERAAATSRHGFAMIVRAAFLEGQDRYRKIFAVNPPAYVLPLSERCGMFKGRLLQLGTKYLDRDGKERSAATATAYVWLVWVHGENDSRVRWIAPCRKRLERPEDYPGEA